MTPPFLSLGDDNVTPEILENLIHLDRFPKRLPIHIQLPHSAGGRTKEVRFLIHHGDIAEDGSSMTVVGFSAGTPGKGEGFVYVGYVARKETSDDGRQRKDPSETRMMFEVLRKKAFVRFSRLQQYLVI